MNQFEHADSYRDNGFVLLRNVISKEDVQTIRDHMFGLLDDTTTVGHMSIDEVLAFPTLWRHQFNERIVSRLKQVLGNQPTYMNDFDVQFQKIDTAGPSKGWHIDAGYEAGKCAPYLLDPDYSFCKVGLFFQPNTIEYGGGIDVQPGGHELFRRIGSPASSYAIIHVRQRFGQRLRRGLTVETRAGDVLIFDSRLPHASTAGRLPLASTPHSQRKLTVYWDVAGRALDGDAFFRNAVERSLLDNSNSTFYRNYLRYHYPDSYPSEYVDHATRAGINIQSLPKPLASAYAALVGDSDFLFTS